MKPLEGKIALVAGATRGAGRGIATMLGEAGATVYCTGRSVRGQSPARTQLPQTIDETAELVTARGGRGIAVRVDHSSEEEVAGLAERIRKEQGRLDILVNDVWGGEELIEFSQPFWKVSPAKGRQMVERGVFTHLITSRYLVPLMVEQKSGLVVEVTDGDSFTYRGMLWYDLAKSSVIRIAFGMARELRNSGVTALAVTPGFLRSEEMLIHFGVTEANWREGVAVDANFIASETPYFVGRAVAALAADPKVAAKSGRVFASWTLAREYGFKDIDGSQPDWGRHFEKTFGRIPTVADEAAYASWQDGPMEIIDPKWPSF